MKILIIEDEAPAANRLRGMLEDIDPEVKILDIIVSINSAVKWFQNNPPPDLILQDIQLADGISFEIYKKVEIFSPVIFVTAFDEYAIQAFKLNSIDYLLKPLKKEELVKAINKYKRLAKALTVPTDMDDLLRSLRYSEKKYKNRFLIRFAEHIKKVDVSDIAYFYTQDKINFLRTFAGQAYPIDNNLDFVEKAIDPEIFFRINRQFIINIDSIEQMYSFSKSRVKISLKPPIAMETIVSTDRSPHFKTWLGDE